MILQFGKRQHLVGQCQQMLSLLLHNPEIPFLLFRLSVQTPAFQNLRSHQDGAQRCLHVVNHGIREILPHLGNLVLTDNNPYLIHDTDNDQRHNQHRGNQQQRHTLENHPIRIQNHPLQITSMCHVESYRLRFQIFLPLQLCLRRGCLQHIPQRIRHTSRHLGRDTDRVQQVGINGIQTMQGHVHLERIQHPFLQGDKDCRFDELARFRSGRLQRIAILHLLFQFKLISIRGILLPIQLLPEAHPTESFLKRRVLEELMTLPHDILPCQLVSIDQPDILQFDNRNQSHYRNPANVFHLHNRIFFT